MNIKNNVSNIEFTIPERIALNATMDLLNQIRESFDHKMVLHSISTGECIEIAELDRVIGVIDGIVNSRDFEVL